MSGAPGEWVEAAAREIAEWFDPHTSVDTEDREIARNVIDALAPLIAADRDAAVRAALDEAARRIDEAGGNAWQESGEDQWDQGYNGGMGDAYTIVTSLRDGAR